jgi:hypothetical protein
LCCHHHHHHVPPRSPSRSLAWCPRDAGSVQRRRTRAQPKYQGCWQQAERWSERCVATGHTLPHRYTRTHCMHTAIRTLHCTALHALHALDCTHCPLTLCYNERTTCKSPHSSPDILYATSCTHLPTHPHIPIALRSTVQRRSFRSSQAAPGGRVPSTIQATTYEELCGGRSRRHVCA